MQDLKPILILQTEHFRIIKKVPDRIAIEKLDKDGMGEPRWIDGSALVYQDEFLREVVQAYIQLAQKVKVLQEPKAPTPTPPHPTPQAPSSVSHDKQSQKWHEKATAKRFDQ